MLNFKVTRIVLCLIALCSSLSVNAEMMVNRIVVEFQPDGSNREDVEITNRGDEPMFIDVRLLNVSKPGVSEVHKQVLNAQEVGFIVTPNKMVIPGKGKKVLRLVNLNPDKSKDKVFRVDLIPVAKNFKPDVSGVRILVGYQLLVLVPPEKIIENLDVKREGGQLVFDNQSNTYALVSMIRQCERVKEDLETPPVCTEEYPGKRVYAGGKWLVDLQKKGAAEVVVKVGGQNKKLVF